jgi:hypothetical protein
MYVTENYIAFLSPAIKEEVLIPFRDVTLLKKESAHLGLTGSIKVVDTRRNEVPPKQ